MVCVCALCVRCVCAVCVRKGLGDSRAVRVFVGSQRSNDKTLFSDHSVGGGVGGRGQSQSNNDTDQMQAFEFNVHIWT